MRLKLPASLATFAALMGFGEGNQLRKDESAVFNTTAMLSIVVAVITAVVTIAILAALAPQYLTDLASLVGVFNDPMTTTGDASADALLPIFALLLAFGGLFAIVGLGLAVVRLRRGA